jgi:hypothetical protein
VQEREEKQRAREAPMVAVSSGRFWMQSSC